MIGLAAGWTLWRVVRVVIRVAVLLVAAAVVYLGVTAVQVWLTSRHDDPHVAQAIVVMGAAQYDGTPSPVLQARLDEAYRLWSEHLAPLVVVTGSKQSGDRYTEAASGAAYLQRCEDPAVPSSAIVTVGGDDSWQNLALAATSLRLDGVRDVLLVTDGFHEDRSLAIAHDVGLVASPVPAADSPIQGWSAVPYFAKETVGVAVGRIIGFSHLETLHQTSGEPDGPVGPLPPNPCPATTSGSLG